MSDLLPSYLLVFHIVAGSVSLVTAGVALATSKGGRWHVGAGRVYAVGMTLVFVTAIPLAILATSTILFLIALFSFYLVFAGWRFARNRQRRAYPADWVAVAVIATTGLCMWGYAIVLALHGSSQWVTLVLFGGIAIALGIADAIFHWKQQGGQRRVARHLTNMMAGTIATITAVTVVNVSMEPVWVPWVLPTIVITPLIIWWNFRVLRRRRAS